MRSLRLLRGTRRRGLGFEFHQPCNQEQTMWI
jgi:hypothetical protein